MLPGCEADHSPQCGAEVKNARIYTSSPTCVFTAWCLDENRDDTRMWQNKRRFRQTFCTFIFEEGGSSETSVTLRTAADLRWTMRTRYNEGGCQFFELVTIHVNLEKMEMFITILGVTSLQVGQYVIRQCFSTAGPRPGTGPWASDR
jgi:hypothetical protein